ncbi:MAG: 2-oxoisovalerate dehydrogenase [Candidatus Aminicenantes bacterium]|nr:2-oxoisovalerate dehydrogenase [Candidatus Aminicenantes bacterium]
MMSEIIFSIENSDEGGFIAKALGFPIFTEGETFQELKDNIIDAVKCHFDPKELPHVVRLHIVKDEVMAL